MTASAPAVRALAAGGLILLATGAILWAFDSPTVAYVASALTHAGVGIAWTVLLAVVLVRHRASFPAWAWWPAVLAWLVSTAAAAVVIARGALTSQRPILMAHVAAAVAGSVLLLAGTRRWAAEGAGRKTWLAAAVLLVAGGAAAAGHRAWDLDHRARVERIVNPLSAPLDMDGEGEGPRGAFFPSSSRTAAGQLIDSSFFLGSESCARCHADVFEQWNESAHHFSSFNNQWYRKSIEYMQDVAGQKPARWCAGCHDPAPLFSGMMEKPVREILHEPEAQAGLGCTACHAISHVASTMGQGDYTIRYPPLHGLLTSGNTAVQKVHDAVTYLDPAPHRDTFLRTYMRRESERFCSACHKVHLDVPVNDYRWFRGFNEYDAWQNSGVAMNNARAFYHPKEGRTCVDCHMPKVASKDPAAKGGLIRSHRFIAANTALPTANNHPTQLRMTQEFLAAGKISVDVFAVSEAGGTAPVAAPAPSGSLAVASFSGSEDVAPGAAVHEPLARLRGPFGTAPVRVRRGEAVRVEVVVRTRDVGHLFPGGTMDAFDVWLELKATDETGRVILWSGEAADGGKGPVDPSAHRYHTALIDARGNPINKRNAWAARALVYARAIPPGAADTAHFRLAVPADAGERITIEARVNHRKFAWWNTQFSYAGRRDPGQGAFSVARDHDDGRWVFDADTKAVSGATKHIPDLPITVMARDTKTIEVLPAGAPLADASTVEDGKDRVRWNDYGIGLLLQGHLKAAEAAFLTVTRIEPGYADGWVNVARCRLEEGNVAGAREMLAKALALAPELAKAHFFMAMADKRDGAYDDALAHLAKVTAQFPGDRVAHNETGRIFFLTRRYAEAVAALNRTLAIDPEDLAAHYNLMLCQRGLGNEAAAAASEKLYRRFKADEPSQALVGPYLRANPHDNNERQPIHEHGPGAVPRPTRAAAEGARIGG